MAINPDRKIITYENIALLQSDTPAHSSNSNSASNLSFLPLVQGINFSVEIPRTNVGQLGSKSFIDQSNRSAPDVNFNVNVFEDFGNLFSGLFSGSGIRDNLNIDRNFYAYIDPKKGNDAKTDPSEGELSVNDVRYYCFKSLTPPTTSWFAASHSGTTIYEENFDGSNRTIIGGPYTNPTAAHIDVQSGKVYYGNKPIHVFGNGANQALVPMSLEGKQFGSFFGRSANHNIFMLGLEDDTTVDLHWERSRIGSTVVNRSGINSTPSGTFTLNAGEQLQETIVDNLGSDVEVDQAVLILNANKNILCAVDSVQTVDQQIMAPVEQHVYRRKNLFESNIVGEAPNSESTYHVFDLSGAFATDIGDGDGSNKAGHIGFSKLSKYFAFAGDGSESTLDENDWKIVGPYPNTNVEISYRSGDNWYVQHNVNLTGEKTNPHYTGFTPVQYAANDLLNGLLYKIEASNPIAFFVDDWNEGDEEVVVGWNDESLPENQPSFGQFLSFGNCFLNNVNISQSVNGLISSQYSFTASNMQAEEARPHRVNNNNFLYTGASVPSFDLTGLQTQNLTTDISGISEYYFSPSGKIIPYYSTNLIISGSGSFGNFFIQSDSIQDFDLNLPIQRKSIYSLGKKYPTKRKALFPSESVFSFSNLVSNFEINGDRSNLKDFLNSDENYNIFISGKDNTNNNFNFKIKEAKLTSQNYDSSIESEIVAQLTFSFELNDFTNANPNFESVSSFDIEGALLSNVNFNNSDLITFTKTITSEDTDGRPLYSVSRGSPFNDSGQIRWSNSTQHWRFHYFPSLGSPTMPVELFPSESREDRNTPYPFVDSNNDVRPEFSNLVFS